MPGLYSSHVKTRNLVIIPVTHRVKGYTRFVGKYVRPDER